MYVGMNDKGEPITVEANDLMTHGVILGRTGSGKTGLTISLLEEVSITGASAIIFDPKGDVTNVALSLASKKDFEDWVSPDKDPLQAWKDHDDGLSAFGLDLAHVEWWRSKIDVTIYAPGKTHGGGKSVNVFPNFLVPHPSSVIPRKEKAARDVSVVLSAVDKGSNPYDPAQVYLTEAVLSSWRQGMACPMDKWPQLLATPPGNLKSFGGMELNKFFPSAQRTKLARKLVGFQHHAARWLTGEKLDIEYLATGAKKPQISVFSMRHLSEADRQLFTSLMLNKLVEFMYTTRPTQKLKMLVVLDEARGYLPPHPYNPASKKPICTLIAQGRSQGIGVLLGTQNPMDLDYKALSNVGTWFVGRLRERDCARDLISELDSRDVDIKVIQNLQPRHFLLIDKHNNHTDLQVRWCYNHLRGPLSSQDLARLDRAPVGRPPMGSSEPAPPPKKFWGKLFGGK